MTAQEVLNAVEQAGGRLTPHGDTLTVEAPAPLPDVLIELVRQHKADLLALLQDTSKPPLGKVGRHGLPCHQCGDTWQWPTSSGQWVCADCYTRSLAPGQAPRIAQSREGATPRTISEPVPDAVRAIHGADGRAWTVAIYRCPQCGGTRWGNRLDDPEVWCCLDCAERGEQQEETADVAEHNKE